MRNKTHNTSCIPLVPFYFIRHGETEWNQEHKIMGHKDIPLNSVGIKQAHQAMPYLQDLGIERLVSSPLLRAKQTANIIKAYLNVPLGINENLSEICWGEKEGQKADPKEMQVSMEGNTPQGAESYIDFLHRIKKGFAEALNTHKKTLIVAHNGVYWALMNTLGYLNCPASNCIPYFFRPPEHPKGSWVISSLKDKENETFENNE